MILKDVTELAARAGEMNYHPTIAVASGADANALETVIDAREKGLADAVLTGSSREIEECAEENGFDISGFRIIEAEDDAHAAGRALEAIKSGKAKILMKGAVPTATLMRRVVEKEYGLRTDRILSHTTVFNSPREKRLLLLADAGINIAPDATRKRDIIINSVGVAHALGIENPKVAALSYVEKKTNLKERSIADAVVLTEMNRGGQLPGCIVDGPFALDNAVSEESARIKKIESKVAGKADILLAHDLHMGNVIYKALQVWVGSVMAGVVVGSKMPIILTSRADSAESKFYSLCLAIFLAGGGVNG